MHINIASEMTFDSIVDGPGLRMVIWTQGCPHACKGCHNPQTHDYETGTKVEIDTIIDKVLSAKLQKGITISGGEPFIQPDGVLQIVKEIRGKTNLDIWMYSGYTFEKLVAEDNENSHKNLEILKNIDVLVDGKFEEDKKNIELLFKGSSNQRVIDVRKTLQFGKIIEWS